MTSPPLSNRDAFLRDCIGTTNECAACLEPFDSTYVPAQFSQSRYFKLIDEMCERMEWSDCDDEEEEHFETY